MMILTALATKLDDASWKSMKIIFVNEREFFEEVEEILTSEAFNALRLSQLDGQKAFLVDVAKRINEKNVEGYRFMAEQTKSGESEIVWFNLMEDVCPNHGHDDAVVHGAHHFVQNAQ